MVTPILIDWMKLSAIAVSALMAVMFVATVIGQLPLGALLDRVGARWMLSLTTLSAALGTILFAVADGYWQLFLARVLLGLGFAVSGAAIHVIVAAAFPRRDFAYVQGLIVSIGGIGGLLGTWPLAAALVRVPWPVVFLGLAVLTFLLCVAIVWVVPARRTDVDPATVEGGYLSLLALPEMRKLLVMAVVVWAPIVVVTGLWGGAYLQRIHGLSAEAAGGFLFAFYAATIVGAYGFGAIDRRTGRRKGLILTAAFLSAACYGLLAALPSPGVWVVVAVLTVMILLQQFHVALVAHLRAIVPEQLLGRASALFTLVAVSAIPTMQMGFGAILDLAATAGMTPQDGFRLAFGAVGLLIALAACVYATVRQANEA